MIDTPTQHVQELAESAAGLTAIERLRLRDSLSQTALLDYTAREIRIHVDSEIELRTPTGPAVAARYVFRPLGHVRAFFDALTLYVVLNFLRRPLRFFGSIGLPIFVVGALVTIVLVI